MSQTTPRSLGLLFLLLALPLSACGGGDDPPPPSFTVGGTVSGLSGSGLVLQLNGANDLAVAADGAFTFGLGMADGASYEVTVASAPPGEVCTVSMGIGVIASANVTSVQVTCSAGFEVGGTLSGLTGPGLVLQLNGGDDLPLSADGAFVFPSPLPDGASYSVTVLSEPAGGVCSVSQGVGTIAGADVDDVEVICTPAFSVGGEVIGLDGGSVVLQLDGSNDLAVGADGPFVFPNPVPTGAPFVVTVLTPPPGRTCALAGGSGTIGGGDVTGVAVVCRDLVQGLVGADTSNPAIYTRVDPTSGAATPISWNIAFDKVAGLAFDPTSHRLFATDVATGTLLVMHPLLGDATAVGAPGALGFDAVNGLAFDGVNGVLYGISSPTAAMSAQLVQIDRGTGVASPVGLGFPIGNTRCLGLAFDEARQVLYTSTADGRLIEVNPATGASRGELTLPVVSPVEGLAYDAQGDRLYGVLSKQRLIRIVPTTGQVSFVGLVNGYFGIEGLAYADEQGRLLGTSSRPLGASFLVDIDENSALARTVGSTGFPIAGLADDPTSDRVFGITSNSQFVLIDPNSGESTFRARVNTPNGLKTRSLAYNPATSTLFTFAIDPTVGGEDLLIEFNDLGFLIQNHGPVATTGGNFEALTGGPVGATMFGILDRGMGSPSLLYQVQPGGMVLMLHQFTGFDQLRSLALDPATLPTNPTLYTVDTLAGRLVRIDVASGDLTDVGATTGTRAMTWIYD